MAKTLKFVYAMIIFLSLFLMATNIDSALIECQIDDDCPPIKFAKYLCINYKCRKICLGE
ncbi:putative Late nodulin [Medicago truncatula]|uniref:Nodule Cysteine-Rich (NCR) secreted peptide n=1 Tax=Medicago truncatula TaxID=3880 RepID=A0A072UW93_MEDTR|nr:Nodule Cysteine-Rich (NCR) secreted peptide [Medicago truncatula]RHN60948.1 putative Late nodulin [Medicago truncatula]